MTPYHELFGAIFHQKPDDVARVCREHPELAGEGDCSKSAPLLVFAARYPSVEIVRTMIDVGFNINVKRTPEDTTPLVSAIGFEQDGNVQFLLSCNPDLTLGRPLVSAVNPRKPLDRRLRYVEWLLDAGVDVNATYDLYGQSDKQFTVLDWTGDQTVKELLRSRGAKTLGELRC